MTEIMNEINNYFANTGMPIVVLDLLVILIVAAFFWVVVRKNARAKRKVIIVLVLMVLYAGFQLLGLPIVNSITKGIVSYWLLLVAVVFSAEIRMMFEEIEFRFSSGRREATEGHFMRTIMSSVETLSKERTGALITIERNQPLDDYIEKAIILNADLSEELIESIFNTQAPTHDGAVIIKDGKIACCGAYFPSTSSDKVAKTIGSRHRAAMGISEIYDCLTIVVSEETGRISVTVDGFIERNLNKEGLQSYLTKYID